MIIIYRPLLLINLITTNYNKLTTYFDQKMDAINSQRIMASNLQDSIFRPDTRRMDK